MTPRVPRLHDAVARGPMARSPTPHPGLSFDRMFLRGIEAHGWHGVHDFERANGQRFVVDIDWWIDTRAAVRTDRLGSALCYAALYDAVVAIIVSRPCALIETLADRIIGQLLGSFAAIEAIELTVHKPDAPIDGRFGDVGVCVFRTRPVKGFTASGK